MPQAPSRQSDTPSTFEINDPTTEDIAQTEPSHSKGGRHNLRPNPNPNYSEIYRYRCVQNFILVPFVCHFHLSLSFFLSHILQPFLFSGAYTHTYTDTSNKTNQ